MELPRRQKDDVYLPDGAFTAAVNRLQRVKDVRDLRIVIVYAYDERTYMLPYWYVDKRMAPCSVRLLADTLDASGFEHVRVVQQQWAPNFKLSQSLLDGEPIDVLMVSAMQVHAERAYEVVRDAYSIGENRPLILAGGPKAIYEPTDYFELGPEPGVGADCSVTGEVYVLLELLETIFDHRGTGETMVEAFERARYEGALDVIPGLVYLEPNSPPGRPIAINTGIQRLLRDLDEYPMPDAGYRLLEPPHRQARLASRPLAANRVRRHSLVSSVISTQGCKFNCSYCPIPAVTQRTWRHKSPERLAEEISHIYKNFRIRQFFSTDDNFFNSRETVIELMTRMAKTRIDGRRLSTKVRFFTEATEFDVYKNRDLLPLCREGGLRAIWFGIEDIMAELVNKGQNEGKTAQLFELLRNLGISPNAMMIHSDEQPLYSAPGDLSGVINQAKYLFENGAITYQCTYLGPAIGTRDIEQAAESGILYKTVGGEPVPQSCMDGNHVIASRHGKPWERQINILKAYSSFYNPMNTLRVLLNRRHEPLFDKRLAFQIVGQLGMLLTMPKLFSWARKLKKGPIHSYNGLQRARLPMVNVHTGEEVNWAIEHIPSSPVRTRRTSPVRTVA